MSAVGFPSFLGLFFGWAFDGLLGVRFFFIISGFLITWLLIAEKDSTGSLNLTAFYMRRALRILPVYGAFLLVLLWLQLETPYRQSRLEWISDLTFTRNFFLEGMPSRHLWSLSVEEQFYLLWPGLFALFGGATQFWKILPVIATPIIIAPIARVISYIHFYPTFLSPLFFSFSTLNYFDSLAVGCGAAILFARAPALVQTYFVSGGWYVIPSAIMLILVPYILMQFRICGIFTVPLGPTFQALGFSILLLKSVTTEKGIFRALNWAWVRWIGVLSYSIYIWQQLFYADPATFGMKPVWWMSFPGWLASAFAAAIVSYYCLERPLFRLRARLRIRS